MVTEMSNMGQFCPDVLKAYLGDYSLKLSASEISSSTGVERRTVSRILNKFVDSNLMNYVLQGRNKLFYFDLKNNSSFSLLSLAELNYSLNFGFKYRLVNLIISKLLNFCDGLIIFGSYASMKNKKDSDLDVVLLGKVNLEEVKKIKKLSSIEINEHVVSYSEFKKILKEKNPLALEISENHVFFGNFSQIVRILLEDKLNG